jgi:hypothetical protein
VVDAADARIEVVHDGVERFGLFLCAERERRHALERHVDEDAEGAQTERDGRQQVGLVLVVDGEQLAIRRDERGTHDLGRQSPVTETGAMGAGRERSGDGLTIDVAEVRHRETVGREQRRNAVQSRAGQQAHTPALAIDGDTPLSSLRSSRVPGAAAIPVKLCPAPTALSARPRAPAERTERRTASIVVGYSTSCGRTLGARPVLPCAAGSCHRKLFPSPR